MKTQIITILLLLLGIGLFAQNKTILQTQTKRILGTCKEISLNFEVETHERGLNKDLTNAKINASNIGVNRTWKDSTDSGHTQQTEIPVADNTIACSSHDTIDYVIAARNQKISFFKYTPNFITTASVPLRTFSSNNLSNYYVYRNDTKLIYDPILDRFILVFLYFELDNNPPYSEKIDTKLYVLISKSNDPFGNWYEVEIDDSEVISDPNWMDRPQIAISDEELFITINVYDKASSTYQDNLILALKKDDLAQGLKTLNVVDIVGNPPTDDLFGLVPVSYGQEQNFGPGLFFVRNDSEGSIDSLWYYRIPTNVYANPNLTIYKSGLKLNDYERGVKLLQQNSTDSLVVDDCRILDAFYLNGIIHYVFHAKGASNPCEVIYNRLDVIGGINTEIRYTSQPGAYPSLASFALDSTDKSVGIDFLSSDMDSYPGFWVVACADDESFSNDILLHKGDTIKSSGAWGDYIGAARMKNGNYLSCWVYGNYASSDYYKGTDSYMAEVVYVSPNGTNPQIMVKKPLKVFPNPTQNNFSLTLGEDIPNIISVCLTDMEGKVVKVLYSGNSANLPTKFSTEKIAKGTYILTILNSQNQIINYEKLLIY